MKANAIRLYKHYCNLVENPTGKDAAERELTKKTAEESKKNMEEHFKNAPKYKDDTEIKELLGSKDKKSKSKKGK